MYICYIPCIIITSNNILILFKCIYIELQNTMIAIKINIMFKYYIETLKYFTYIVLHLCVRYTELGNKYRF